jgi:hypothetical protein
VSIRRRTSTTATTKAVAGLVLSALTFGVFAWSTQQLDDRTLLEVPRWLLFGTIAGIVLIVQALRRAKPPPALAPIEPPRPARAPWSRDVTM